MFIYQFLLLVGIIAVSWENIKAADVYLNNFETNSYGALFFDKNDDQHTGSSVSGLGDVNGDGYSDILIGAYNSSSIESNPAVVAYMVHSKSFNNFNHNLTLSTLTSNSEWSGTIIIGRSPKDSCGYTVSSAGDFNNDGFADFAISCPHADYQETSSSTRLNAGVAYLIFGSSNLSSIIYLNETMEGSYSGLRFWGGMEDEQSGMALAGGVDVNGDSYDDFFISAPYVANNTGVVYMIYGRARNLSSVEDVDLGASPFPYGVAIRGAATDSLTGYALAFSNMNGDSYPDLIIGAPTADYQGFGLEDVGMVYVLYGGYFTDSDIDLSQFISSRTTGFTISGASQEAHLGACVGGAGDVNNDGIQDLITLAVDGDVNTNRKDVGVFYVIYGRTGNAAGADVFTYNLDASPSLGYRIFPPGTQFRYPQQCLIVGDQNNDNIADLAIVLAGYDPRTSLYATTGTVFVIYGVSGRTRTKFDLNNFGTTGQYGYRIVGGSSERTHGMAIASADLDDDGTQELFIGRSYASLGGSTEGGAVYLLRNPYPRTRAPTAVPTILPSQTPTAIPTRIPTLQPTATPTIIPTLAPSARPTAVPTAIPSTLPTIRPSAVPTRAPTVVPSAVPSIRPTPSTIVLSSKTYRAENLYAFATVHPNIGIPLTWGAEDSGGILPEDALQPLQRIVAGSNSFVGLTVSGGLVAWGTNSSIWGWRDLLYSSNIVAESVVSTGGAYAGITTAGGVFAIGNPAVGGDVDLQGLAAHLQEGVFSLTASASAFAALTYSGEVFTWGHVLGGGGVTSGTMPALSNVYMLASTSTSFAALREDGSVVTFGDANSGGNSSAVAAQLASGVVHIVGSKSVFAAFKLDGSLVTWGHPTRGGDSSAVAPLLAGGVVHVAYNDMAFAALKADGSVVTWGEPLYGGDSSAVQSELEEGVSYLYATGKAFAALTSTGRVVAWGASTHGGEVPFSLAPSLASGVRSVSATRRAFAALKEDGSVVVWGNAYQGGEAYSVAPFLISNVTLVCGNEAAFTAVRSDGLVVGWGHMAVLGTTGGTVLTQNISFAGVTSCA